MRSQPLELRKEFKILDELLLAVSEQGVHRVGWNAGIDVIRDPRVRDLGAFLVFVFEKVIMAPCSQGAHWRGQADVGETYSGLEARKVMPRDPFKSAWQAENRCTVCQGLGLLERRHENEWRSKTR